LVCDLTIIGVAIGVLTGAVMGYFGGKVDLISQRIIEVWSSMPELYLLIIFASIFAPSVGLLIILLSLFGWMGLSDYVRAEFLKKQIFGICQSSSSYSVYQVNKSCGVTFCQTA